MLNANSKKDMKKGQQNKQNIGRKTVPANNAGVA